MISNMYMIDQYSIHIQTPPYAYKHTHTQNQTVFGSKTLIIYKKPTTTTTYKNQEEFKMNIQN